MDSREHPPTSLSIELALTHSPQLRGQLRQPTIDSSGLCSRFPVRVWRDDSLRKIRQDTYGGVNSLVATEVRKAVSGLLALKMDDESAPQTSVNTSSPSTTCELLFRRQVWRYSLR